MTQEIWKAVPGYEGSYEVSDLGRVRSLDRITLQRTRWGGVMERHWQGAVLAPRVNPQGYFRHILYLGLGEKRDCSAHEIVALAFLGPRPDGFETRHLDGNAANNTLANLCYGTTKDNAADRLTHGRQHDNKGEKHGNHKFKIDDITEMRRMVAGGCTQTEVAEIFDTSQGVISAIVNRKAWRHV